jgi:hypothetical protein
LLNKFNIVIVYKNKKWVVVVLAVLWHKVVVELEDADIRVEAERVKCVDMDANALANARADVSGLHAHAIAVALNLAVRSDAGLAVTDADVRRLGV